MQLATGTRPLVARGCRGVLFVEEFGDDAGIFRGCVEVAPVR